MASLRSLASVIVDPLSKHTATVIFIHGLGDTGFGWEPVAKMFQIDPALSHIKWVLPHAPTRPVTANMGTQMPSWFDIISFSFDSAEDEKGMLETMSSINSLISTELSSTDLDPSRIILGGFSQGGSISLLAGLTSERKLGGVAVLSGWLPLRNKFKQMAAPHASQIPLFWGHGIADPLVLYDLGTESVKFLTKQIGFTPTSGSTTGLDFRSYKDLGHSTCRTELDDLSEWIKRIVPKGPE